MSRHHILRMALVPLVAASLAASLVGTAAAADIHVGASVGRSDYRIDTTGAISADTKDTAGKLFVGMAITPTLGIEAALFDLGRASGSVDVPGGGTVAASARVRGIGIAGVLSAPVGPVSLFAKAGLAHVRTQLTTSVNTGLPGSEGSWQPTLGFGLSHAIDRQWAVRAEWERVRARFPGGEKDDVDLLSVGLGYRF